MTSEIKVDTISEQTSANGVAVDGVTLKDGGIAATAGSTITVTDNSDALTLKTTDADANIGPILLFNRDSASPADNDFLGAIDFQGDNDAGETHDYIRILSRALDVSNGAEKADLVIKDATGNNIVNMAHTEVVYNDDSVDRDFRVESNGNANMLFVDGGNDVVTLGSSVSETRVGQPLAVTAHGGTNRGGMAINSFLASSNGPLFDFSKSRNNTAGSHTVVQSGDALGTIIARGDDGDEFVDAAFITFDVDGTPGGNDMPGRIVFGTTADGANGGTERMRIDSGGHVSIGTNDTGQRFTVLQDQADEHAMRIDYNTNSADESLMRWHCARASNAAWDFLQAYSNNASSPDLEFQMTSGGNMTADGSFTGSGADYAEYFETTDGKAIEIGKTVILDGEKVRASTSSDDASKIIGVVRPKDDGKCSMTIGNTAWNHWTNKYLTDDYGVFIWEDYVVKEWTETINNGNGNIETKNHSYPSDYIPDGVTAPADAKEITQQRKKQNPSWNKDTEYKNRQNRDEWVIIGLLGQIPINKNEKTGTNWIKMRDISDTVEEWLVR